MRSSGEAAKTGCCVEASATGGLFVAARSVVKVGDKNFGPHQINEQKWSRKTHSDKLLERRASRMELREDARRAAA